MIQRQITNHDNNLLVLVRGTRVLSEIILKFRYLKYKRSVKKKKAKAELRRGGQIGFLLPFS
jgi:hypothetical protein